MSFNLDNPNYGYNSSKGFAARMTRMGLEESSLGRARTSSEEREYLEASITELELEFPELAGKKAEYVARLKLLTTRD